jgi:hypothetical protein
VKLIQDSNMKINSLKVAGLYSFGPQQNFDDFSIFNLFIGKSDSGKTNALKILGDLKLEYAPVDHYLEQSYQNGEKNIKRLYTPKLEKNGFLIQNRQSTSATYKKLINIQYKEDNVDKAILFAEFNSILDFVDGDLFMYNHSLKLVELSKTDVELQNEFNIFCKSSASFLTPFSIWLSYIFEKTIIIQGNEMFHVLEGLWMVQKSIHELSKGMQNCIKLYKNI